MPRPNPMPRFPASARPCGRRARFAALALAAALAGLVAPAGATRAAEGASPGAGLTALAARVRPAFAFVAGGSGAVISPDGEVVTNNHVVENLPSVGVTLGDGRAFRAEVLGRDRQGDLALLKLTGASGLPFLPLGSSAALRRGEACYAAGNPLSLGAADQEVSFSAGVVSALHQFRHGYNDAIVVDAAVNPGNSGGPLVNRRGELVGICGMTQTRLGLKSNTGVAFAIPVDQLKLWLPFLRRAKGGNVFHGRLDGLDLAEDNGTVTARAVAPGSSAAAAGFRPGDVLAAFMGYHVPTVARFDGISGIYPAGSAMQAVVRRARPGGGMEEKTLRFSLPPLRPWKAAFALARPRVGEEYPRVGAVMRGGAAEKAGVAAGDEIMAINDLPVRVSGLPQLTGYLSELHAGDRVELQLRRDGRRLKAGFVAE